MRRALAAAALAAALLAGQPAAANAICSDRDALLGMIAATQAVQRAPPDAPPVDLARILNEAGGKLVRLEDDASIEPSLISLRRQFAMNYRTLRVALAREGTHGAQAYLADREVQAIASVLEAMLDTIDCGAAEGEGPKEDGAATADPAPTGRRPELRLREGSAADDAGPRFDPTAVGALAAMLVLAGVAVALLMRKEQRQDARFATDVEVGLTVAGASHTARMHDISLSGAKIQCATLQPAVGDAIDLVTARRSFPATVIWQANGFVGVRFKQRIPDSQLPALLASLGV